MIDGINITPDTKTPQTGVDNTSFWGILQQSYFVKLAIDKKMEL